ncbi:hypothetical protein [Labrenzia sp. OB1]|uniref:hypothetical protein n=1 Tax=Labrenzia sp. OB1 TaxID=1561204 RepID=UPI000A4068F4|nr:hypothetical protein [Labrenzia sp. OB1]
MQPISPLPTPMETVHIILEFTPDWVDVPEGPGHGRFQRYPDLFIEYRNRCKGLYET